MLPGKRYTVVEVAGILIRGKWIVLIPLALGLMAAPWIASRVPRLYRSETLITVERQQIPESYVKVVTPPVAERLPAIREQILSRSRLERIIRDLDLYREQRNAGVMEDVVSRMRGAVDVRLDNKESFRVTFVSDDPKTAQAVTQRLASLSIEESLKERERVNEGTNQFLESQVEDAKQRLLASERSLETYRQRHAGQLPSQLTSNLQSIQNAQMQLQALNESMNRARERRIVFERQLGEAETEAPAPVPINTGNGGTPVPMTTAQQLEAAQARKKVFEGHYTADHPDMKALDRSIRELEARLAEEAKLPAPERARVLSPSEAQRQKRLVDLKAELEVIDHQLSASQTEATRLRSTIDDLQSKVSTLPTRESELTELMRDYTTVQETYESLRKKQEDAKLAGNLQRRQIGEQFTILDAASLPERPFNGNQRLLMTFAGAIAGFVFGLGVVGFREIRDSNLKTEEDVLRLLSVPVLALIPEMASDGEKRQQRLRAQIVNVVGTLVLIGSVAALVVWRMQA